MEVGRETGGGGEGGSVSCCCCWRYDVADGSPGHFGLENPGKMSAAHRPIITAPGNVR